MSTDLAVKVTGHKMEIAERERLCVRSTFWLTLFEVLSPNIDRHTIDKSLLEYLTIAVVSFSLPTSQHHKGETLFGVRNSKSKKYVYLKKSNKN